MTKRVLTVADVSKSTKVQFSGDSNSSSSVVWDGVPALAKGLPSHPALPFTSGPDPANGLAGTTCCECGGIIKKGQQIVWTAGATQVAHAACVSIVVSGEEEEKENCCECGAATCKGCGNYTCSCVCESEESEEEESEDTEAVKVPLSGDYAEPTLLQLHAIYDLWELPTIRLPQEAADFYLLEYLGAVLEHPQAQEMQAEQVARLAPSLANYTNFAVGGELRHVLKYTSWGELSEEYQKFYPDPHIDDGAHYHLNRPVAWRGWHAIWIRYGIEAVDAAETMFHTLSWGGSCYGGSAWGRIAGTLAGYLKGTLRPKLFIDRVWSIQHNGGTLLNKAPHRLLGLEALGVVLDWQERGNLIGLQSKASTSVLQLYATLTGGS